MVTGHGSQWSRRMGPFGVSGHPEGDSAPAGFPADRNACTFHADTDTHLDSTGDTYTHTDGHAMAYEHAAADGYTRITTTNAYPFTHSTPTGHSHGGGLPPAISSGETGGQPNSAQLGASAQEHIGTGSVAAHHAGHHGDPGSDLGPEEIGSNNRVGCQAKALPASPTIGPSPMDRPLACQFASCTTCATVKPS